MEKLNGLKNWFKDKENVLIAFSGGVDSALLLAIASQVLDDKVLAVTVNSPLNTSAEKEWAIDVAKNLKANHLIVEINDLENSKVSSNPTDRCYHCKKARFEKLKILAQEKGYQAVIEGSNLDDLKDYRPGLKAVEELGILSPLIEVGLTKKEIREAAKNLNLSVWDKPSEPCLATRFPFGIELTLEKLKRIEVAEKFLKKELNFSQVRVRDYLDLVRIEVETLELAKVIQDRDDIIKNLQALGYQYITLDLEGYRTGSMNKAGGIG